VSVPRARPLASGQTVIEPVRASHPSLYEPETRRENRGVLLGRQSSKLAPSATRTAPASSARTP
jgi:hypothetical protein